MTMEEIKKRLTEIAAEIEQLGDAITEERLTALEKEARELLDKQEAMKNAAEQRQNLLASIAEGRTAGTVLRSIGTIGDVQQRSNEESDPYATPEYRRAFQNYVMRGAEIPAEFRADATTKTSDAGAVIPTNIVNRVVEKMEQYGHILTEVTRTAYKGGVSIPTASAKPAATWVKEGAGSDKQKKALGSVTFAYHKLRCAIAATLEMETMALSAFEMVIENNITEAMTMTLETAIVSGNGTGKPKGILAETAPTGQALSYEQPSYQALIDAEAALPLAYENNAKWCMTKKTFAAFAGMVDANGQPIARINYGIEGKVERVLLGRPVILANDGVDTYSESLTAGKVFAFLFNFRDYTLNTNYAMTIKKYEDNDTEDTVTKAVMLVDGKVVDKNSLVTLAKKAAATPGAGG